MPINDPYAPPSFDQPRLQVLTNGQPIGGAKSFEIANNNYYQADTFTAEFAIDADPNHGISWWDKQDTLTLDIQASIDAGNTWTSLIIGEPDSVEIDIVKGRCTITGRDLTRRFIDAKTQETFQNQTSSQVVQTLAARHGMTADVTATTTPVGRYYGDDHDRITLNQFVRTTTEWNLICSLAQHEQFDVWVTGTTIHFHPQTDPNSDPYVLIWQPGQGGPPWSNGADIVLRRSLTLAKDVVVVVRSWNSKQARSFTKYSPSSARIGSITSGKEQEFAYVIPNLTETQAQDTANKLRAQITKHERLLEFRRPADFILTARKMVRLQGTSSGWDQAYYVDSVTRRMAVGVGFTMDVRCKNHSPQTAVLTS